MYGTGIEDKPVSQAFRLCQPLAQKPSFFKDYQSWDAFPYASYVGLGCTVAA